jgi:hypothetical protein
MSGDAGERKALAARRVTFEYPVGGLGGEQ